MQSLERAAARIGMAVDPFPPERTIYVRVVEQVFDRFSGSNDALLNGREFVLHTVSYGI